MCGIVGSVEPPNEQGEAALRDMLASIRHRGPDGCGVVGAGRCHLGLTRLAIIDTAAPSRPFQDESGQIFSVCNGEIYNASELRAELRGKGHRFATGIDTEVLVHLYEEHGAALVDRLNGMFAFAIWDVRRQALLLGRDRAGEKPLFYFQDGERIVFASEIRALLEHPAVTPRLDARALLQYLAHGFMPAPISPLAGVRKLPAGHVLVADREGLRVSRYWDLAEYFPAAGEEDSRPASRIAAELDERIAEAVRSRSLSDVPLGVFLSGGIDSATLLAHMTDLVGPGIPAFTLGHEDLAFDESRFAAETARALGAEPHALVASRSDLTEGLHAVGRDMDEPLGDASTIPMLLLSRFARQRVKVVLSGEGADELFGGYPTYLGHRLLDRLQGMPAPLRRTALAALRRVVPVSMGNVGLDYLLQQLATGIDRERTERHFTWFGTIDPVRIPGLLAPSLRCALGESALRSPFAGVRSAAGFPDALSHILYIDFTTYLQDDLLTKVDRTTMLASLESRVPFLDHRLAEMVARIPSHLKVRGLTTKAILRRAVRHRLPAEVLKRRKRGFNIPFSRWVLEGLGEQLRERFSPARVEARGLFSAAGIGALLAEHMERRADHRKPLFTLLAFDLWCDRTFGEGSPVPWS
jgi:asparagine synthase (glutamine-hydrolysing)